MADIGGRRQWIKLHITPMLHGTTRKEMEPDERSVWYDFLCLAGDSAIPGVICMAEGVAFTEFQLAKSLNISEELLTRAVDKMMQFGKITVDGEGCFQIVNWEKYQGASRRDQYMREYMPPYMRKYRRKQNEEREQLKEEVKQLNVKPLRKTRLMKTSLTRKTGLDETRLEENREDEKREDDNDPGVVDIHEKYFGLIGIPNEKLMDTFVNLSAYPMEKVEELYRLARAMSPPPRYPAGYILAQLENDGKPGRRKPRDDTGRPDPKEYLSGRLGHLIHH